MSVRKFKKKKSRKWQRSEWFHCISMVAKQPQWRLRTATLDVKDNYVSQLSSEQACASEEDAFVLLIPRDSVSTNQEAQ